MRSLGKELCRLAWEGEDSPPRPAACGAPAPACSTPAGGTRSGWQGSLPTDWQPRHGPCPAAVGKGQLQETVPGRESPWGGLVAWCEREGCHPNRGGAKETRPLAKHPALWWVCQSSGSCAAQMLQEVHKKGRFLPLGQPLKRLQVRNEAGEMRNKGGNEGKCHHQSQQKPVNGPSCHLGQVRMSCGRLICAM